MSTNLAKNRQSPMQTQHVLLNLVQAYLDLHVINVQGFINTMSKCGLLEDSLKSKLNFKPKAMHVCVVSF